MPETQPTRSERKRQAILEAARAVFRENGVDGTSMDALAARADVSKRTVYHHFPSKQALVRQLMSEMWKKGRQKIRVKYDGSRPLEPQLLTLVGTEIELVCNAEYLGLLRVAIGHFFYSPAALQGEVELLPARDTALSRWLAAARDDGRLDVDDPEFAATQLVNLVRGACFWPQVMGMAPIPDRDAQRFLAEETLAMFLARYQPVAVQGAQDP